jgi:3-keto-disaccharide hydrolase
MVKAGRSCRGSLVLLALLAFAATGLEVAAQAPEEPGFRSLFNGADLTGWDGLPGVWSVEDGAITGRNRAEAPLEGNTFLIWKDGTVGDFTLRLKFRFQPVAGAAMGKANSGVQYRSQVVDPAKKVVGGYQADMDGGGKYVGMLYEERGRGILALPTQKVRLSPAAGKPGESTAGKAGEAPQAKIDVLGATASETERAALTAAVARGDWMDLNLVIEGRRLRHYVNGVPTAEIVDDDDANRAASGVLALQVHAGEPMMVQFKEIRLKASADATASPGKADARR